jgi:hypothetical protein
MKKRSKAHPKSCPLIDVGEKTRHLALTANQCKVLKPIGVPLGCGVYGCAYDQSETGKVVKFTKDPEDVAALEAMSKTGDSVPFYSSYQLRGLKTARGGEAKKPVYAVIVDKVEPLDYEDAFYIDQVFGAVARSNAVVGLQAQKKSKSSSRNQAPSVLLALPGAKLNLSAGCKYFVDRTQGTNLKRCLKVTNRVLDITRTAAKKGLWFTDSHSGNFGYLKGKIVVSDLGLTYAKFDKPPASLRGLKQM